MFDNYWPVADWIDVVNFTCIFLGCVLIFSSLQWNLSQSNQVGLLLGVILLGWGIVMPKVVNYGIEKQTLRMVDKTPKESIE